MACFFFPFLTVSCAGDRVTASGIEVMTATSFQDEYDFSEFSKNSYLVLTVILAGIGLATTKREKSLAVPGIASAGATISLLLFRFRFYSFYGIEHLKGTISIDFRWGWWLSLLFLLVATGTAASTYGNSQNNTANIESPPNDNGNMDTSPPNISSSPESDKTVNSNQPPAQDSPSTDNSAFIGRIIGIVIIIAVVVFGWKYLTTPIWGNKKMPQATDTTKNQVTADTNDQIVASDIISLAELCNAYSSNAIAADRQYANQRLNVQGEIASITPSPFDDTVSVSMSYASTESLENFSILLAYFEFDSTNEGLYDLEVGKVATLSGYLESGGSGTRIQFSDATLYGQEPSSQTISITWEPSDYIGEWGDSYSQRCFMTISDGDTDEYYIEISWSSSAWETTEWYLLAQYNDTTGELNYIGTCYDLIYTEDGDETVETVYADGTGKFYFDDGYLHWQDDVEHIGDNCLFEKF